MNPAPHLLALLASKTRREANSYLWHTYGDWLSKGERNYLIFLANY